MGPVEIGPLSKNLLAGSVKSPTSRLSTLLDLEVCGPGLYSELFAESGYQVTGVDFSKRSIDYAQRDLHEKTVAYFLPKTRLP